MAQLFQPFYRGTVKPSLQGLGLGLYIASEIARVRARLARRDVRLESAVDEIGSQTDIRKSINRTVKHNAVRSSFASLIEHTAFLGRTSGSGSPIDAAMSNTASADIRG